jgi:hypothetical protein
MIRKGIVVIQLDVSKAFDTVPHQVVEPVLHRFGIPPEIRSAIINLYEHLTTTIHYQGSKTEVSLWRGVKQGDPLSPFIFNSTSCLAFADDLLLLADDAKSTQKLLDHRVILAQTWHDHSSKQKRLIPNHHHQGFMVHH